MPAVPPEVLQKMMQQRGGKTPADANTLMSAIAANPQMLEMAMQVMRGGGEAEAPPMPPAGMRRMTEAEAPAAGFTVDDIRRMNSDPSRFGNIYAPAGGKETAQPAVQNSKRTKTRQGSGEPPLPPKRPPGKAVPTLPETGSSLPFPWWLALLGARPTRRFVGNTTPGLEEATAPRLSGPAAMAMLPPPGAEGRPLATEAPIAKLLNQVIADSGMQPDDGMTQHNVTSKNPERRYVQGTANPAGDVSSSAFNEEMGGLLEPPRKGLPAPLPRLAGPSPALMAPPPLPEAVRAAPNSVIPLPDQSFDQIIKEAITKQPSKKKKGAKAAPDDSEAGRHAAAREKVRKSAPGRKLRGRGV